MRTRLLPTFVHNVSIVENFDLGPLENSAGERELIFEGRKKSVSFRLALYQCQIEVGAKREGLPIDFRSTTDKNFFAAEFRSQGFEFRQTGDHARADYCIGSAGE